MKLSLGKIHLAGLGLAVGAMGQMLLLPRSFCKGVTGTFFLILFLLPWLPTHFVSFFRVPPCSPRAFAKTIRFSVSLYLLNLCFAELTHFLLGIRQDVPVEMIAQSLALGGLLNFLILIPAIRWAISFDRECRVSRPTD
jgi:hypothetical protein